MAGIGYWWTDRKKAVWTASQSSVEDADIEVSLSGLAWKNAKGSRTLVYNLTVPAVRNNIDICLFNLSYERYGSAAVNDPELYLALGELKGGIDPAGADEHWKTARTALGRIHTGFAEHTPATFFIGAAIEKKMAGEIWSLLEDQTITNAANLTSEDQVSAISRWICNL